MKEWKSKRQIEKRNREGVTERERERERERECERGRIRKRRKNRDTTIRIAISKQNLFGHVMRREKLVHLVTSGMIVGKRRQKMLDGLTK